MRTVIYSMGVSLDCYITGPDGNDWGDRRRTQSLARVNLELLETRTFSNRIVYLRDRRA